LVDIEKAVYDLVGALGEHDVGDVVGAWCLKGLELLELLADLLSGDLPRVGAHLWVLVP